MSRTEVHPNGNPFKGGGLVIKRLLIVIIVIVLLTGFCGDWLTRIPEVVGTLWQQLTNILAAVMTLSGST
jgi:hypothetical protein